MKSPSIVRGFYTTDSPRVPSPRLRTRDDLLTAVPVGKVMCLGTVYTGELRPFVDATVAAISPLVSGFTSGAVLHAEPIGKVLDLGTAYTGNLRDRINDAADRTRRAAFRDAEGKPVDITELARAVEQLEAAFGGGEPKEIGDAFERFQRSRDTLRGTRDADRLQGEREHASRTLEDLNRKHSEFWARQDSTRGTTDGVRGAPGRAPQRGNSVAEINRRNATFWSQQGGNGPKDAA